MEKIAYIVPGRGMNSKAELFRKIGGFFRARGISPIPIDITWKYRTISDYVEEFLQEADYRYQNEGEIYLFGFSMGSMISFISSPRIKPKLQILCSLSPYFKEDLRYLPRSWKRLSGKRRIGDFRNYSFDDIAKKVRTKTILFVGSEESKQMFRRVNDAHKKLRNSRIVVVSEEGHKLGEKYLRTLEKVISEIQT